MTSDPSKSSRSTVDLLRPVTGSQATLGELFFIPIVAVVLALLLSALIMLATSVEPANIVKSFVALAYGSAKY